MFRSLFLCLILWGSVLDVFSQQTLPTLKTEDYKQWQSLAGYQLSDDGRWVAYQVRLVEGNDTLFLKSAVLDKQYQFALASNAIFTPDSKWAAFRIGFSEKTLEAMQEKKTPVEYKAKLLNLETGGEESFESIQQFAFSGDGRHLILEAYPPKDSKTKGRDLIVRNLQTGATRNIGNVAEWKLNKKGDLLAYTIDADKKRGNGVELFNLATNQVTTLASDTTAFLKLSWEKEGQALAFLQAIRDTGFTDPTHRVYAFKNLYLAPQKMVFDPSKQGVGSDSMRIKESYTPLWSRDLTTIFLGIEEWTPAPPKGKSGGEEGKIPGVEVWHWKDDPVIPVQRKTLNRDQDYAFLSAWNLESGRFVRFADEKAKDAVIAGNHKTVILEDKTPYQPQFRLEHADYYLADVQTGQRKSVMKNFVTDYFYGSSPDGKYLLYFKDGHWFTYDIVKGRHLNLTEKIEQPFWNTRYDGPRDEKPSFGMGGWMKGDTEVLLYDEFDTWAVKPDGTGARLLTDGRKDGLIYRFNRLDFEEDYIDPAQPLVFNVFGDKTKKSGFMVLNAKGKREDFFLQDKSVRGLRKAKDAAQYVFTAESYTESPNVYVGAGPFAQAKVVSNTNPQQKNYAWGKTELINYKNQDGKDLQGVLHYPANYEPGKKYPMITYIYEIRSNSMHNYVVPTPRNAYNLTHFTQQGYFVFQPDIVYKTNHPGESAVECVVPAVEKVIEKGFIDEKRIGLMGHSWGGYQTAFLVTQTNLFAAAVAGAPLTNMISMYNSIYWNSGTPDQQIFETSQGRLREPYWKLMDEYIANSPMFQAQNIQTPLLVTFGDNDGAVDWHQGIEMYTTMRRMEKPMILLVYAGENHGLAKKENQMDYAAKVNQFFDHHLNGGKAAPWITEGQTVLEKKKLEEQKNKVIKP